MKRTAVLTPTGCWENWSPVRALAVIVALLVVPVCAEAQGFDFSAQLFGPPSTLSVSLQSTDPGTGIVSANGGDSRMPTTPFTWDWGDGNVTQGFFPQQHTYGNTTRNYIIAVTAHYPGGGTDSVELLVSFVAPQINPVVFPPDVQVTIPATDVVLGSHAAGFVPPTLSHFADSNFGIVPRATIEYVATVAASIEKGFVNGNVANVGGGFQQVLLRDPTLSGGTLLSLWFTDPVSFVAAGTALQGTIPYSSLMHEMGHNFTLNTPANFFYGGKIDGPANAIYSETMAQIFQHASAFQLVNNAASYGLGEDIVVSIKNSSVSSMKLVRNSFDSYVAGGAAFHSWNDPGTPEDETFNTFMTIAYKFFEHAENSGLGYRIPLRRMLELLQVFNADTEAAYDRFNDTPAADAFRATLMVAAMSHGFQTDLRSEFTALNFPVNNATYDALIAAVPAQAPEACCLLNLTCLDLTMDDCVAQGGDPRGAGTSCASDPCLTTSIPTVSTWGMVVMVLLVLAAGTVVLISFPMSAIAESRS